jgi:hypothetical protein
MASTNIQAFSGDVTVTSNLTVDTDTLHVDSVAKRIGIGKTDPAFALDVSGTINATSLYAGGSQFQGDPWSSNASNIYYTTGAVGVGTDLPTKTLEVQGTLRLSNVSTGITSDLIASNVWDMNKLFYASNPAYGYYYGYGVAMSNNAAYATIGMPYTGTSSGEGALYIYKRTGTNTWDEGTLITPTDPTQNAYFGQSVAMSGDGTYAITAAWNKTKSFTGEGAAYIYKRTGDVWGSPTTIVATDPAATTYFGYDVDMSDDGNYAIVGAYNANSCIGVAYILNRTGTNTWSQVKIAPSDISGTGGSCGFFGKAVSISSDGMYAVAGAYYAGYSYYSAVEGGAYVFKRTGTNSWDGGTTLMASDKAFGDYLGSGVAISGDGVYIIAGAPNSGGVGAAYIFKRTNDTWSQMAKLVAPDGVSEDFFGQTVEISHDGMYAVVGAYNNDDLGNNTGSVYIFKRTGSTWDTGTIVLPRPPITSGQQFGTSISMSGDNEFLVSAPSSSIGRAFTFKQTEGLSSTSRIVANGILLSFTGQHMCFPDGPMSQGQIVSANKNKYVSLNGPLTTGAQAINSSESLPVVCLSNVVNDKNVFGVVDRHEHGGTMRVQEIGIGNVTQEKEWGDNRVIVNSIGEGAMWVTNTNGNLVSGNYITTSNIAGYGQKQHDNKLHSYTVAKITMDCDFEPKDLPIQVIKKDVEGNNILDTYGRIQWEDTDKTEKAYRIRYLTTEGQTTDQANAVWTAAYVGCTYHCG